MPSGVMILPLSATVGRVFFILVEVSSISRVMFDQVQYGFPGCLSPVDCAELLLNCCNNLSQYWPRPITSAPTFTNLYPMSRNSSRLLMLPEVAANLPWSLAAFATSLRASMSLGFVQSPGAPIDWLKSPGP